VPPAPGVRAGSALSSSSPRDILRSPVGYLLGVVFSIDCMTALIVIAFGQSYLIQTRHAPPAYPAYSLAIYGLVKLMAAPIGGWALDRARAGAVVVFIVAVELGGFAVIFATASANGYLLGVALLSTGIAVAWLVVFHALGDTIDASLRGTATAYLGLTSAAATAAGFGIGAIIGETTYWETAFALGAALACIAFVLLFRLYPSGARIGQSSADETAAGRPTNPKDRQSQVVAGMIIFAHFVAITGTIAVFGPYVLRVLGLSLFSAGVALIPAGVVGALTMILAGRRSRPGNRLREVAVLYSLGAAAVFGLVPITHVWVFVLVAIPLAAAVGGAQPLLNASLLDVSQSSRQTGRALGWLFFAEGLGSVAGPVLIGGVIAATDVRSGVAALGGLDVLIVIFAAAGSRAIRL
jgi:predicted MFS family arabinose efflux permease